MLRLPRKMRMDTSKVLPLPRKLQHIFWKRRTGFAPATRNDFRHGTKHVWMSPSATPATRNEATRRLPFKGDPFCRTYHRHAIATSRGQLRTVADDCERLRTVANSCERLGSVERTHPQSPDRQTPRVKREPLLRIREKPVKPDVSFTFCASVRSRNGAHGLVTKGIFCEKLAVKCRRPRLRPILCASRHSRNALGQNIKTT